MTRVPCPCFPAGILRQHCICPYMCNCPHIYSAVSGLPTSDASQDPPVMCPHSRGHTVCVLQQFCEAQLVVSALNLLSASGCSPLTAGMWSQGSPANVSTMPSIVFSADDAEQARDFSYANDSHLAAGTLRTQRAHTPKWVNLSFVDKSRPVSSWRECGVVRTPCQRRGASSEGKSTYVIWGKEGGMEGEREKNMVSLRPSAAWKSVSSVTPLPRVLHCLTEGCPGDQRPSHLVMAASGLRLRG